MGTLTRILGLAAISLMVACASGGRSTDAGTLADLGTESAAADEQLIIVFENNQYTDCTVYYNGSGGRRRLGRVTGNSRGRFVAPDSPTGFRITAAYQAVGDISTQVIQANLGQTVTVTSHTTGNLTFTVR
jgi:hypothetical protein